MNDSGSGKSGSKCSPSQQERSLWRAYVRDVTPLSHEQGGINRDDVPDASDASTTRADRADQKEKKRPRSPVPPASYGSGEHVKQSGNYAPQMDRRTDDKLRRGKLPIEARLDLHGMFRETARHTLAQFLREAYTDGKRCVLIITGKGALGASGDSEQDCPPERGVLRRSVPEWLATSPLSDIVIGYYPARAKDGGDGALYVLLKRKRG